MTHAALAGHPFGTVITEDTFKTDLLPPLFTVGKINIASLILLGKQITDPL